MTNPVITALYLSTYLYKKKLMWLFYKEAPYNLGKIGDAVHNRYLTKSLQKLVHPLMSPFSRFSQYFVEVAHTGSLRKAAEILHVSASAINRQILQAEQTMETPLFERLPTGLKLTSAGEVLFDDIKRWRKEFTRTREKFDEMQGLRRGHVTIAMIAALSEGMIAQLIADIGKEYPNLTFNIRIEESRNISEHVSSSEVDFGLLLDPVEHTGLEVRAFAELPIGIAMPKGHPLAHKTSLSFSDITEYRQIIPSEPLMVNARAKLLYNRYQLHETPSIVCNDVRMMRELIRKGAGVGVLSLLDVIPDLQENRLAFVPLQGHSVKPLTLALCVAPRRQLSRAAQIVIQKMIVMMETLSM